MGMKTLKSGEDFSFPADFGFTGSVAPRAHPTRSSDEFGDDAKLTAASKVPTFADGGQTQQLPGGKKMPKAGRAIMGALQIGKAIGQAQAGMAKGAPGVAPGPPAGASPLAGALPNAVAPGGLPKPGGGVIPGMKKGGRSRRKMADGGSTDPESGKPGYLRERYNVTTKDGVETGREPADAFTSWYEGEKAPAVRPTPRPDPGHAKGGFIKTAIKHPGRMKKLAKEHGVSVHQEMEHDKHSSNPSLRSAANLGLRLTGGDLAHKRKR